MTSPVLPVLILTSLVLAACSSPTESISPDLGNSVTYNKQIQMVNPEPSVAVIDPTRDGHTVSQAYERYRDGKVARPVQAPSPKLGGAK